MFPYSFLGSMKTNIYPCGTPFYNWRKIGVLWADLTYLNSAVTLSIRKPSNQHQFQIRNYASLQLKGLWICQLSNLKVRKNALQAKRAKFTWQNVALYPKRHIFFSFQTLKNGRFAAPWAEKKKRVSFESPHSCWFGAFLVTSIAALFLKYVCNFS